MITTENAKTEEKAVSLIQKSLQFIRKIGERIKEIIDTIISWISTDGSEKSAYKKFVQEAKNNPEFAGKKITIHDYRAINAEYEKVLSKAEKDYQKLKDEEAANRPNFFKDIAAEIKSVSVKSAKVAAAAATSFSVQTALEYCRQNRQNAYIIKRAISNNLLIMKALEMELGKKEVRKFKKKVNALTSKSKIIRTIYGGRLEQSKTLKETISDTLSSIRGVSGTIKGITEGEVGKQLGLTKQGAKLTTDIAVGTAKEAVGIVKSNKRYRKDAENALKMSDEMLVGRERRAGDDKEFFRKVADKQAELNKLKHHQDASERRAQKEVKKLNRRLGIKEPKKKK